MIKSNVEHDVLFYIVLSRNIVLDSQPVNSPHKRSIYLYCRGCILLYIILISVIQGTLVAQLVVL